MSKEVLINDILGKSVNFMHMRCHTDTIARFEAFFWPSYGNSTYGSD
jgi:hypothetical protein